MKKSTLFTFVFMMLSSFLFVSCAGDDKKAEKFRDDDDDKININIGGKDGIHLNLEGDDGERIKIDLDGGDIEAGINQLLNSESVDLADFRKMKELLPSSLSGMKRTSIEGQKSGIGNLKASTAEATYKDGDSRIEVSIIDAGGMGMMMSTMAGWANIEIDQESDHGYERTTIINGHKAFESYDSKTKDGNIAIIVDERLIVSIDGSNVTEQQMKDALEEVSLRKLKRLIR